MNNGFKEYNLDENIIKALNFLKYDEPSEVQQETIPRLLKGKDIIVKSQTGSGKTASFGIPVCNHLVVEESQIGALILVPTRELALQVKEELANIGRLKKIRCAAIFGKQPFKQQVEELKQRVHVVVGTPGRVIDHIERGNLDLSNLKYVIIDEADKMMNMGFVDQIEEVLKAVPKNKTTALFSATFPEKIQHLCEKYMNNPERLDVKAKVFNKERIHESYINVDVKDKFRALLKHIYGLTPEAALVFCNTRGKVKEVYDGLRAEGISVEQLHGDMEQKVRIETMNRFKAGEFKILVATDIAARGIHIDQITHVFNFEVPMELESYVHRIGRTGRAGKEGSAITFVSQYEEKYLKAIEEYVGYSINKGQYPNDEAVKTGKKHLEEEQIKLKNTHKNKKEIFKNEVIKIYLSAGKKKKIRNVDILGALSNLKELQGTDIGIIDVQDNVSYVDILNNKGEILVKSHKEILIKGKKIKLEKSKK